MDQVRVHVWNGTMARGRRMDIKALDLGDGQYELRWYGSGYDRDPWAPHWLRSNSPHQVIEEMRGLVEAEPQYPWRDMPVSSEDAAEDR